MRLAIKALALAVALAVALTAIAAAGPAARAPGPTAPLVRLPFPQDDGSLTPYTFELGYSLLTLVYDTVMWRDEKGAPQPWLARSVEQSADARQVTVRLTPGIRWHDGVALTSADVAFTFGYLAHRPHPRFTPQLRAVDRVETPDPTTAVISLRHPSPGFLDQPLADVPILPAHLWQGLPAHRPAPEGPPVGSGPYRLVEHRPGERYRFEANTEYFRGRPTVEALEVPVITDAQATLEALKQRRVDMIPVSLPEQAADQVRELGIRLARGPSYAGTVLMFNLRRPPFDQREARQAVARALDLERIARAVGEAVPAARGYLHPDSPWSSTERLHDFDDEAARQGLSRLAIPTLQILAPDNDPSRVEAARQVALALERVGVGAEARPLPRHDLDRAVGADGSPPSFQAAIWVAPPLASYDPDFLRRLFTSGPDASFNYPGYTSPAFDAALDRVATTAEPRARRAAVGEGLGLLAADVPVVPLFFPTGTYAYRPAVYDGWVFVAGTGILDKRSFLTPRPAADRGQGQEEGEGSGGGLGYRPAALGLFLVAAALAALALVRRRR